MILLCEKFGSEEQETRNEFFWLSAMSSLGCHLTVRSKPRVTRIRPRVPVHLGQVGFAMKFSLTASSLAEKILLLTEIIESLDLPQLSCSKLKVKS